MTYPKGYEWLGKIGTLPRDRLFPIHRFNDGSVRRPAQCAKTIVERHRLHAISPRSLSNSHRAISKIVDRVTALVPFLRLAGEPPAVIRRVGAIIVFAVESMAGGARPHIRKEIGEAFQPTVTDNNAASAIVRIFLPMGRIAAALHFGPRSHGRRIGITVAAILNPASRASSLAVEAPATDRLTRTDIIPCRDPLSAAVALTNRPTPCSANHGPASVFCADFRLFRHALTLPHGLVFAKGKAA